MGVCIRMETITTLLTSKNMFKINTSEFKIFRILLQHIDTLSTSYQYLLFDFLDNIYYLVIQNEISDPLKILIILLDSGCNINSKRDNKTFLESLCSSELIRYRIYQYIPPLLDVMLRYGFVPPTEQELLKITDKDIIFQKFGIKTISQYVEEGDVQSALEKLKVPIINPHFNIQCSYTIFDDDDDDDNPKGNRACTEKSDIILKRNHGYCTRHFFEKFHIYHQICSFYIGEVNDEPQYCQVDATTGVYGDNLHKK